MNQFTPNKDITESTQLGYLRKMVPAVFGTVIEEVNQYNRFKNKIEEIKKKLGEYNADLSK